MMMSSSNDNNNNNNHQGGESLSFQIIDGSQGEGGGQILRNSISFACILNKPIEVQQIRARRKPPGLKPQHLTGLRLAASIAGGSLEGDEKGSTCIRYRPPLSSVPTIITTTTTSTTKSSDNDTDTDISSPFHSHFLGDTRTAGSICLLLQAALPCTLFCLGKNSLPCDLELRGGTNADMAPQFDYFEHIFWPTVLQHFGPALPRVEFQVQTRGYYPRGGGIVHVKVLPYEKSSSSTTSTSNSSTTRKERVPLPPMQLTERGHLTSISIRSFYAGRVPRKVALQMASAAKNLIAQHPSIVPSSGVEISLEVVAEKESIGNGSGILIVATTSTGCLLGGSAIGRPKEPANQTGRSAAQELLDTLEDGGCVDEWMQDQLIFYMALAKGTSTMMTGSLTLHTQSAIAMAQQVCGAEFTVERVTAPTPTTEKGGGNTISSPKDEYNKEGRISGKHLIRCQGIGFVPNV